jgi:hypothetical protein
MEEAWVFWGRDGNGGNMGMKGENTCTQKS